MLLSYDLTAGVGDLRMEEVDAERVAVAGDSGDIHLYSVTGTDFTVTQGVGDLSLASLPGGRVCPSPPMWAAPRWTTAQFGGRRDGGFHPGTSPCTTASLTP